MRWQPWLGQGESKQQEQQKQQQNVNENGVKNQFHGFYAAVYCCK